MTDNPLMDPETGEIDEVALAGIIQQEMTDAAGVADDYLDAARQRNINAYLGAKYGNEKEGYSQYVDRTAYETVESMTPYLMKVFHGNDQAVSFAPAITDQEGEASDMIAQAREATDYINFLYNVDNPGYSITQAVIKDALTQRLGWWKHYWVKEEREETRRFSGLSQEEVLALSDRMTGDVRVEVVDEIDGPVDPQTGQPTKRFDVRVKRQWAEGRIKIECVPPDQVVFSRRAKNVDDLPFIGQLETVTRSDLVAEGLDKDKVFSLPVSMVSEVDRRRGRYSVEDSINTVARNDAAMEEVDILDAYIRVDLDGDGIAEWVHVTMGGNVSDAGGGTVLDIETCDGHPFTPLTPIPLPHQIDGLCPVDAVEDLQRLQSETTRQMSDGLFLTNHPRWEYDEKKVDGDALLENAPGSAIPSKAIGSIARLDQRWEGVQAMPWLEKLDRIVERRSGISAHGSVQAASSMTRHAEGTVDNIMQASMARQELVARNMAETGFTRLYRELLKLTINHQDSHRMIRRKGKFVKIDPTMWNPGMDVEVNPGVGVGRSQVRMQILGQVGQAMEKLQAAGFRGIGEEQIYNLFVDVLKAADMPAIDPYCQDVTEMDPPQPPPPPDPTQDIVYVVEEMKQRYAMQRELMKDRRERDESDKDLALEAEKLGSSEAIERAKMMQQANDGESTAAPVQPGPPQGGATTPSGPTPGRASSPLASAAPAETFFPGGQ